MRNGITTNRAIHDAEASFKQYICLTLYMFIHILACMIDPDILFKCLCDETRLRCLILMKLEGELCVCELTYALDEIQPKISRHLALLREAGIVIDRRQGQWIYYRIHPELPAWAKTILNAAQQGANTWKPHLNDLKALKTMPNRPGRVCCA